MNPLELNVGQWVEFEYNGTVRKGRVEEKRYGGNPTCSHIVNGVRQFSMQSGWLLNTADGYRHFKVAKMDNVRVVS